MTARYALHFLFAVAINLAFEAGIGSEAAARRRLNRLWRRRRYALTFTAIRCRPVPSPAWAQHASAMMQM